MAILVQRIVGQFDLFERYSLFGQLVTRERRVWMDVDLARQWRVRLASHQPGRSVVGVPIPLVVNWNRVHGDYVLSLGVESGRNSLSRSGTYAWNINNGSYSIQEGILYQSCPRVGWTRGSGRVGVGSRFCRILAGSSGRVSTSDFLVFLLIISWYLNPHESLNTTFGLIDFLLYLIYNNQLINKYDYSSEDYTYCGRVGQRVGSGRVRLFVGNRGSGRVNVSAGRVGSGPRKVTRGQLCTV